MSTPKAPSPTPNPLPPQESAVLADFARTCKAAARAVSLYPGTHPAIQSSLARVVAASGKLTGGGDLTLDVHPDALAIDGRTAPRPDPAIRELASLLHERLIGALRVSRAADAQDWHALLVLLARAPEDLIAGGGIGKAWAASGRGGFEVREIDYAEVLREGSSGHAAEWNRIIAYCLQGKTGTVSERAAALLDLLRRARGLQGAEEQAPKGSAPAEAAQILDAIAHGAPKLTPDMMLALLDQAQAAGPADAQAVAALVTRMGDRGIAAFVANAVAAEHGATERLAEAFQALVPDAAYQVRVLDLARQEAATTELGADAGFEGLWQSAASMLTLYSDRTFVSADYARELSNARSQAIEVDRVGDDPPERVQAWLSTVSDAAIRELDLALLLDLLRLEQEPSEWHEIAMTAAAEIERRSRAGEMAGTLTLAEAIARDEPLLDRLAAGPLVRHIVMHVRQADEADIEPLNGLCRVIGPRIARPLAEALATEDNDRAIRRLRELLLGFGAAGRQSVERLKNSNNPAVRRMAIDLLRVFGGHEALPELASMLDDADPQVQREAIRAIVQIASNEAYAVLEHALGAGSQSRDTVLQELIGLRDDKAIPLLCYVLSHSAPRGKLAEVHTQIVEALGALSDHPESTRTLRQVLYRGEWWAPRRTAALRTAAATALRRIGSADTLRVLDEAAEGGSRGVRQIARAQRELSSRRERARS